MSDLTPQEAVRNLAALTALEQVIATRKAEIKASFGSARTTVYATVDPDDPTSAELGRFTVPKPTQPSPRVVDEDQAVAYAVEHFGESAMDTRPRLSETGRKDVLAAAKRGTDVPGVETPPVRPGSPTFTPAKDVVALVEGMVRDGRLVVSSVLPQIGGGQ